MPDAEVTDTPGIEQAAASGEQPTIRLAKAEEMSIRSDMWQPPPLKKSTLLSSLVGIMAILGTVTGGTTYLGNAQGEAETQIIVQQAVNESIRQMEDKVDQRSHRLEARLDKIDSSQEEMKLDIRDLQRDIRDMSK